MWFILAIVLIAYDLLRDDPEWRGHWTPAIVLASIIWWVFAA